jgi:hypothetical protein
VADSNAHIHDGILNGNLIFLGSFFSCLDVNVPDFTVGGSVIEGFR